MNIIFIKRTSKIISIEKLKKLLQITPRLIKGFAERYTILFFFCARKPDAVYLLIELLVPCKKELFFIELLVPYKKELFFIELMYHVRKSYFS